MLLYENANFECHKQRKRYFLFSEIFCPIFPSHFLRAISDAIVAKCLETRVSAADFADSKLGFRKDFTEEKCD